MGESRNVSTRQELRQHARSLLDSFQREPRELAQLCGVAESTARTWLTQKTLPHPENARLIIERLSPPNSASPLKTSVPSGYNPPQVPGTAPVDSAPRGEVRFVQANTPWRDVPVLGTVAAAANGTGTSPTAAGGIGDGGGCPLAAGYRTRRQTVCQRYPPAAAAGFGHRARRYVNLDARVSRSLIRPRSTAAART